MKLYDFSLYAKKRQAARSVAEAVADINRPGSVIELKEHVRSWLDLHREVTRKRA